MNKTLSCLAIALSLIILFNVQASAQISVVSTNGYVVSINVQPSAILPATFSCAFGYNYNVKLNFQVSFAGSNIPASLFTLQGTVACSPATSFFNLPNNGGTGTVNSSNAWNPASDCNTSTPVSLACNTINIDIAGPGISSRTVSYAVTFTPLPVSLLDFTAHAESGRVKLNWSTASETNNDHFVVERSIKTNEWNDIEKVKGAINSSVIQDYSYYDEYPVAGTLFYRLKQVDIDGHVSFSRIASIDFHQQNPGVSVYPVPNRGNTVGINGISDYKNYELVMTDMNERVVYSTTSISASMNLPVLNAGIYMMRFSNKSSNEITTIRYMKL